MKWIRTGKTVSSAGTTITYELADGSDIKIESRKRHIPHANRSGTWDHTSYFVIHKGTELRECHSLREAKTRAGEIRNKLSN